MKKSLILLITLFTLTSCSDDVPITKEQFDNFVSTLDEIKIIKTINSTVTTAEETIKYESKNVNIFPL